jgi:phosphotriesterase-related protein
LIEVSTSGLSEDGDLLSGEPGSVMTVTGPLARSDLGRVLVHEHVLVTYAGAHLDPTDTWDREQCIIGAVERMKELLDHGVNVFVDPCPIELGRDPELLAEVSERSGMNIVCATGFYFEHNAIGIPFYWRARTAEEIAEFYLSEIEGGIGQTGIRPGVIKAASGDPPGLYDRQVLRGAALAAYRSGLPIVTHCENSNGGAIQQEIFEEMDVPLDRCLIGHQDQSADPTSLLELARRGSFVGIDRVGATTLAPESNRVKLATALADAGLVDRLCLSQDHLCSLRAARHPYAIPAGKEAAFARKKALINEEIFGRSHTYLFTDFLPLLRSDGWDDETIETVLTENPRRLLTGF